MKKRMILTIMIATTVLSGCSLSAKEMDATVTGGTMQEATKAGQSKEVDLEKLTIEEFKEEDIEELGLNEYFEEFEVTVGDGEKPVD